MTNGHCSCKEQCSLFFYDKDFSAIEALKENLMHSNIQTTESIYGVFGEKDIKDHYLGLHDTKGINLLEEIPPQDQKIVLELYQVYKKNTS